MSILFIQGNPKRGNDIIKLLQCLGGKTEYLSVDGKSVNFCYYINKRTGNIDVIDIKYIIDDTDNQIYSIYEFEEKFPFKLGDTVLFVADDKHSGIVGKITRMIYDENSNNVLYYINNIDTALRANNLKLIKEMEIEDKKECDIYIRKDNMAFEKTTYLTVKNKGDKFLSKEYQEGHYNVVKYEENPYYGKENDYHFIGEYATSKIDSSIRIHESCFHNKETKYTLATVDLSKEDYDIVECGDRVISLSDNELLLYRNILQSGIKLYKTTK